MPLNSKRECALNDCIVRESRSDHRERRCDALTDLTANEEMMSPGLATLPRS